MRGAGLQQGFPNHERFGRSTGQVSTTLEKQEIEWGTIATALWECSVKLLCIPELSVQARIVWDPKIAFPAPGADQGSLSPSSVPS